MKERRPRLLVQVDPASARVIHHDTQSNEVSQSERLELRYLFHKVKVLINLVYE